MNDLYQIVFLRKTFTFLLENPLHYMKLQLLLDPWYLKLHPIYELFIKIIHKHLIYPAHSSEHGGLYDL